MSVSVSHEGFIFIVSKKILFLYNFSSKKDIVGISDLVKFSSGLNYRFIYEYLKMNSVLVLFNEICAKRASFGLYKVTTG